LNNRERGRRYCVRWLKLWLDENEGVTIEEAAMVASSLAALGGRGHQQALTLLRGQTGKSAELRSSTQRQAR
jgi:hypothetical protein